MPPATPTLSRINSILHGRGFLYSISRFFTKRPCENTRQRLTGCWWSIFFLPLILNHHVVHNTVDHNILIRKLHKYGMGNECVTWFENYLSSRYQTTKVLGNLSTPLLNTCGVPQGSNMGPLLFILYINDLVDYLGDSTIGLYADDTAGQQIEASTRVKRNTLFLEVGINDHN